MPGMPPDAPDAGVTTWRVTEAMQTEFIEISGDSNPLHTDPLAARRLPFGRVAVHGLHLALDALDRTLATDPRRPDRLRCTFRHPVGIGDDVTTAVTVTSDDEVSIAITHDVWTVADLEVGFAPSTDVDPDRAPSGPLAALARDDPAELDAADLADAAGEITIGGDVDLLRTRFAHLVSVLGEHVAAELVSLTRVVGMRAPGRHSLFSSFDIRIRADSHGGDRLSYATERFDERFSSATIAVTGPTIEGQLRAFLRPRPVESSVGSVRPFPDEFSGQRWLIVGGSRGLGAIAVILLTAGSADVRLTYRTGTDDALAVAAATGASAYPLDVTEAAGLDALLDDQWHPTHIGFFASPPIFDGVGGTYSDRLEQRFTDVYIGGLGALLTGLDVERLRGLLWPSSEAAAHEVPGLAEYANVKRRGEQLCRDLGERHPDLVVATPRFPRLRTDQSTSFVPVEFGDAPETVLAALRHFSG